MLAKRLHCRSIHRLVHEIHAAALVAHPPLRGPYSGRDGRGDGRAVTGMAGPPRPFSPVARALAIVCRELLGVPGPVPVAALGVEIGWAGSGWKPSSNGICQTQPQPQDPKKTRICTNNSKGPQRGRSNSTAFEQTISQRTGLKAIGNAAQLAVVVDPEVNCFFRGEQVV